MMLLEQLELYANVSAKRAMTSTAERRGGRNMSNLLLARLQFGVTTVYHFLFVPLTIGLVFLIAIMETAYVITNNET